MEAFLTHFLYLRFLLNRTRLSFSRFFIQDLLKDEIKIRFGYHFSVLFEFPVICQHHSEEVILRVKDIEKPQRILSVGHIYGSNFSPTKQILFYIICKFCNVCKIWYSLSRKTNENSVEFNKLLISKQSCKLFPHLESLSQGFYMRCELNSAYFLYCFAKKFSDQKLFHEFFLINLNKFRNYIGGGNRFYNFAQ